MKYCISIFAATIVFLSISCNRLPDPQLTVPIEISFDIQPGLNTLETHFFPVINTPTFLDLSLGQAGSTKEDITSIISQNARFSELDENVNLDFINNIVINAFDNERTVELFFFENIPFGDKEEINLLASISELNEMLNQDFVNFEVGLRFRQSPPSNFKARVEMDFSVFTEE